MVIANFESRALPDLPDVTIRTYDEKDDPYQLVKSASSPAWWHGTVAISDDARSRFLLGLQSVFPETKFEAASPHLRSLRMVKDLLELQSLRAAARRADEAFERLLENTITGRSEVEVMGILRSSMEESGLSNTWAVVGSGPNGASPHHQAGSRVIGQRDMVVVDFGGAFEGYQSDVTRMISIGAPSGRAAEAHDVVKRAGEAAASAVAPGVTAESIDETARKIIATAGMGDAFIHRTGHGLGLEVHEEPYIVAGNTLKLQSGMVFSIEPGVYFEGEFGIRVEDIVVVTENGTETLSALPRELRIVA
jgi:Xaa-Pro aminopeptidase